MAESLSVINSLYLGYIEGKGVGKDIHCISQIAALFVDHKISFG